MLHEEIDSRATLSTGKALTYLFRGRHHERWCGIVMERAQAFVVDTCLTQGNKITHHINNVGGVHNLVNCRSVYHRETRVLSSLMQKYKNNMNKTAPSPLKIINDNQTMNTQGRKKMVQSAAVPPTPFYETGLICKVNQIKWQSKPN
jgi:hypothetical protein